jgi:hypothetical protein
MQDMTPLPRRPVNVEDRLLLFGIYLDYITGRTCHAVPRLGAVCSVACLERGRRDNGSDVGVQANTPTLLPFEIGFAKEARNK